MITFEQAKNYTKKLLSTNWIQWIHEGSKPAETNIEKTENILLGLTSNHCGKCLNLHNCYFTKDKCPTIPLHINCHCKIIDIQDINVTTICSIEKFTKYIFIPSKKDDKKQLFELWGYDIMDSEYLKEEFEEQAKLAYLVGNYELSKLDNYGQRINIKIKLNNKNKNVEFYSGWMVYPNGKIILTTPYGDK